MYVVKKIRAAIQGDPRYQLTQILINEFDDSKFILGVKNKVKYFTRDRVLSLKKIFIIIMGLNKALQRDLDEFYDKLSDEGLSIREITKGALSQARNKINEWGFWRLNELAHQNFYELCDHYLWDDLRLVSVDGSRLMLPSHPSIKKEFGACKFGPKADSERSMAIASMAYDVLNNVTIDAKLAPYKGKSSSERALLAEHMKYFKKGDLLLLDRGYPALWIFFQLKAKGVEFCVRMRTGWWKDVKDFAESDEEQRIVYYSLPSKDKAKLQDYPQWIDKTIKCKLVKIELENGETEVLCSSLLDEKYSIEAFKDLYHRRWNEEEAYKLLKSRIEIEDFTGKTANAIKQDFYAKVFLMTLTAIYAHPVDERVRREFKADTNRKHPQQINKTNAIACSRRILVSVFLKNQFKQAIRYFDDKVYRTREIIRPGRRFERKKHKKKKYSMNYKKL